MFRASHDVIEWFYTLSYIFKIYLLVDMSWARPKFNIMILFYLSIIPTERTVSNQLHFLISGDAFEYKLAPWFPMKTPAWQMTGLLRYPRLAGGSEGGDSVRYVKNKTNEYTKPDT